MVFEAAACVMLGFAAGYRIRNRPTKVLLPCRHDKPCVTLLADERVTWEVTRRAPTFRDNGWVDIAAKDEDGEPALSKGVIRVPLENAEHLAHVILGNATGPCPVRHPNQ